MPHTPYFNKPFTAAAGGYPGLHFVMEHTDVVKINSDISQLGYLWMAMEEHNSGTYVHCFNATK